MSKLTANPPTYNYRGYRNVTLSALVVCKSINGWMRLLELETVVQTGKTLDVKEPGTNNIIGTYFEPDRRHHRRAGQYRERYARRMNKLLDISIH